MFTRLQNFQEFQFSRKPVLFPEAEDQGINTSDLDLIELDNKVVFRYATGNQEPEPKGWANIKEATFAGSLKDLFTFFF